MRDDEAAIALSKSPFVRRAWVEIRAPCQRWPPYPSPFVRRAWVEIADRAGVYKIPESPFVRRAWVEISKSASAIASINVALREKGVG